MTPIPVIMEWKNKLGISAISLMVFLVFLIFASGSQVGAIFAEAALSIPITLILIEWVVIKERKKQWEKIKVLTYLNILEHMSFIAWEILFYFPDIKRTREIYWKILSTGVKEPRAEVALTMIEIAKFIKSNQENWIKRQEMNHSKFYEENRRNAATGLVDYDNRINFRLMDTKNTLIPRVLQLSDNEEVNLALIKFAAFCSFYEREMVDYRVDPKFPWATPTIARLIMEAGVVYDYVQRDIPSNIKSSINALWL